MSNQSTNALTTDKIGRRVTGLLAALAVVVGLGVAWALYGATSAVLGNQFGTQECFDASVASVQKGQTQSTSNGVTAITISSVDTASALLVFTVASSSNEPADSAVQGRIASSTTIEFTRSTDAGSPPAVDIMWSVVEYSCGVSVQRGVVAGNDAAQLDVTIGAVDPTASFVTWSSVGPPSDADVDGNDLQVASLASPTTVRFQSDPGATLPGSHSYAWQVVSFTAPADASVQTVTASLTPGQTTTIANLASAVDERSTLILAGVTSSGAGPDIGERMVRVHLASPTTVSVTRLVDGDAVDVYIQAITLSEGTTVSHGVVDLVGGEGSAVVSVDPVDVAVSTALSTVMVPGSASGGATDHVGDDVFGEASAVVEVSGPTSVTITRNASASTASFGWQVVEWGGPRWWDPSYEFRQRIDVTTTTVAAPDEYTVPLTFDHAALVASGFSLVNGDDLRVARWDGASWTELHRVLDDGSGWNLTDSTIWFRTQDPIDVATISSYWLYYGASAPPAPLNDPEQVWLLHEDFESGTLGDFEDRTGGSSWYAADPWTRRIQLVIDSTLVTSNLTDFPVLVQLTEPDLTANTQVDGSDLRFTAADGVTPLAFEVEEFDQATGSLTAWVKVPSVSSTVDTTIHLYYGAPDAPDAQDPRSVWTAEVEAAWHLPRDPSGLAPHADDSSARNRDGLSSGAMASGDLVVGVAGDGLDFDGVDDRLDVGRWAGDISGGLTVSGWVRLDTLATDASVIANAPGAGSRVWDLGVNSGTGSARIRLELDTGAVEVDAGSVPTGGWHQLTATWDGAMLRLYVDGSQVGSTAAVGTLVADESMPLTIGDVDGGGAALDGRADEIRIASVARPAPWVAAVHANLSAPATFVGAQSVETGVWFDHGTWSYRKPLAVDADLVTATLTDFPLLVQITDAELSASALADGADIVFTAADGVTRLDHEIESWNAGTGELTAWVRLPTLDASADTSLFVYYGNATGVDQQDPAGVFGPDANAVWHLDEPS